ncbi:tetratricopeptide repeat protein [Paramagnetospirillum magneticum]|uniref:TPR repeat protein n=1 Tax=Paramagnetospirillum magneticum (strain ATCC 700264 / AMB-1) TaxID=342108 RepID=Q2WBE7_PARM1|nr:tetratricopeptide repeat protein [Paramagnetospirillum magneticum]BAE48828.1 TPR repeat protein [Paramagnetospirillum magneticum AMB-1]
MTMPSFEQAVISMQQGRPAEAARIAEALLTAHPDNARLWHLLGCARLQLGLAEEAIGHIRRAITFDASNPAAHANLARALLATGKPAGRIEAEESIRRAIMAQPADPSFHLTLAQLLQANRRYPEAVAELRQARDLAPGHPDIAATLASALHLAGDADQALALCDQILVAHPGHVGAWINRGNAYLLKGEVAAARAALDQAVALAPDDKLARFNRGFAALRAEDYATGWTDYEFRHQRPVAHLPERLEGCTILIDQDQYAGDTFQYIRFVLPLLERGARIILSLPARMNAMLRVCFTAHPRLEYHAMGTAEPPWDHKVGIASLPLLLWPTEPFGAGRVPYLRAPEAAVEEWRRRIRHPGRLAVAINWQGNTGYDLDHFRSVPLSHLEPLATLSDRVDFFSVHGGDEQVEQAPFPLNPLPGNCDQAGAFLGTAALMTACDLVISSDTSTAHLAGALGRPLWLMASAYPEWRWLDRRSDSPWYPTARLFRQPAVGDWRPVAAAIAEALPTF